MLKQQSVTTNSNILTTQFMLSTACVCTHKLLMSATSDILLNVGLQAAANAVHACCIGVHQIISEAVTSQPALALHAHTHALIKMLMGTGWT